MSDDERTYALGRLPDHLYVHRTFGPTNDRKYFSCRVIDSDGGVEFETILGECVLKTTKRSRNQIKALVSENNQKIVRLFLQNFDVESGNYKESSFTLNGDEVQILLDFIRTIPALSAPSDDRLRIPDDDFSRLDISEKKLKALLSDHPDIISYVANNENLGRDLVSVGYRRIQLEKFQRLLEDEAFFKNELNLLANGPEFVWQTFFEQNTWIFGHGLSYQFATAFSDRKLEQSVTGADIANYGKRSDGLMKTQGYINTLCFIEIKHHNTKLVSPTMYRPGTWAPSTELTGGVAQVQITAQSAIENHSRKIKPYTSKGDPTGEEIYNYDPKSYLIIGCLNEFRSPSGLNEHKFRSFELYRRNLRRPEILTFDELYFRARHILQNSENFFKSRSDDGKM